ncbi:MAG: DUF411 domain-containing protein [Castellaniella sp.]
MVRRGLAALAASIISAGALAGQHALTVFHDPACGCCTAWVEYMRDAGFAVTAVPTHRMAEVKARLAVPEGMESCHTAVAAHSGQVIEGHVPAAAITRMLDQPAVRGLAAPGMPANSPGMGPMDGTLITLDFNGRPFSRD